MGLCVRSLEFPDQQQECTVYVERDSELAGKVEVRFAAGSGAFIAPTPSQGVVIQKLMEYQPAISGEGSGSKSVPALDRQRSVLLYETCHVEAELRKDLLPVLNRPKRYHEPGVSE